MFYEPPPYPDSAYDPFLLKCKAQAHLMSEKKMTGERNLKTLQEHTDIQVNELARMDGAFEMLNYFKDNRE